MAEIYHLGIIDYLQLWDTNKKSERFFKTKILQKDASQLSAIEPIEYQRRWYNFASQIMENSFDSNQKANILGWMMSGEVRDLMHDKVN